MKIKLVAIFLIVSSLMFAHDHENKLIVSEREPITVQDLSNILKPLCAKGITQVTFNGGQWQWHCGCGIDPKAFNITFEEKLFDLENNTIEIDIKNWLKANKKIIPYVTIRLHPEQLASTFFMFEKVLRSNKIPYSCMVSQEHPKHKLLVTLGNEPIAKEIDDNPIKRRVVPRNSKPPRPPE